MSALYDAPHQFEPLLPSAARQEPLLAKAHDLARAATALSSQAVAADLRGLLRAMNSYYSNRIEGQHTRPYELEQALRQDFSRDAKLAARQRLAIAHIDAEAELEARYIGDAGAAALYAPAAVAEIHSVLFSRLPPGDLATGEGAAIEPGQFRTREVSVGRHIAPTVKSLDAFLTRWAQVYGGVRRGEAALLAMAAAHQRLGWIHPFVDGNGRVMRLHTHTLLSALGYTGGLWSPLRGFARSVERYYALLAAADESRRGDLDGRGNLSEAALVDWIDYVLDVCLDQVGFMKGMLSLGTIERRIAACLSFEQETLRSGVRVEALRPLHYLFLSGAEIERGEFKRMTGLGERTAVSLLTALVRRGLLRSDTVQGKVRFGLPLHALRFYFPALWPEAEADVPT
ncbi:Fic family protein [Roseateles oligotrophus]|uniref:Fic family protein n=1 Tax=Roseateles oligotrophus TaxID=1769250 RepID=A0ABT2YL18_9BURK|nr:Fic family protein [Roseateles oligotrophus]MCV2370636.1 Fic family protein [Roseateles oligotrophus]